MSPAGAQSTWTGNIDTLYVIPGNWENNTPPVNPGDNARFTDGGLNTNVTVFPAAITTGNWSFDGATSYSLSGSKVTFSGGVTNTSSAAQSIANVIAGAGATVVQNGSGTLTLSGINTYTGDTTISAGTLSVTTNNAVGAVGTVILDGGTFQAGAAGRTFGNQFLVATGNTGTIDTQSFTLTLSGANGNSIIGGGTVNKIGTGTLVLGPVGMNHGTIDIQQGTIRASAMNVLGLATNYSVAGVLDINGFSQTILTLSGSSAGVVTNRGTSDATLQIGQFAAPNGDGLFAGTIKDGATNKLALDVSGTGTLTLTGTNTYTGGTVVCCATLQLGNGGATGSIVGDVTLGGTLIFNRSSTYQFNGTISDGGGGKVVQAGTGTTILTAVNGYTGGTTITAGVLQAANSNAVGGGTVTLNGGTFRPGVNNLTFLNNFVVGGSGGAIDNNNKRLTLSGTISDPGPAGPFGTLTLTGNTSGLTIVTGNNTYAGGTIISNTNVQVGNANALGTGTVELNNAEFQAASAGALTFANNFVVDNTMIGSAIDNNNRVLTITGNITDGNGPGQVTFLNANGAGTTGRTILLGTNTYTGGTTVCFCALVQLGDATHTSSLVGAITVEGELDILRADTTKITQVDNSGTLQFFNDSSASTMTINNFGLVQFNNTSTAGNATIVNDNTVAFNNHSTAGSATFTNNGELSFFNNSNAGGATINNVGFIGFADNSNAGSATINNNNYGTIFFGTPFGSDMPAAGTATINNNSGGEIDFNAASTADHATITTNDGAKTYFFDNSTGDSARLITNGTGFTDFSGTLGRNGDGHVSAGSIEGSGTYYIGAGNTLTVGSNNMSTEVSGVIADFNPCGCYGPGPGTLEKVGTGTMILSGINTYSGGTIFTGGTVSVSQEANLGALSGPLTFNGGILQITGTTFNSTTRTITWSVGGGGFDIADPANIFTVSQTLTGGPLAKLGAGTLVLTGANTYSGGTTVTGGTLAISADNNIGTGPLALLNGTTLQFLSGFTFTHAVTVSGDPTVNVATGNTNTMSGVIADGATPGDIVKTGGGTLIFTADNTYTGGTTISAGILQLGNGGTSGSVVGGIVNNATLAINRSDTVTLAGNMSGIGAIQQNGPGTTVFTGTNTYTGGTTINAGTLQLGNGGAGGSITGNVTDNGIFAVNRSDTYTFDGVISGAGAFQQNGAGRTILTATSTYTGATSVNAGTLSVNGSIASSSGLDVNNGATVGGTGTLPTTRINAGGTLSPGNSIGLITVAGNLTFAGAGNYVVEVSSTADRTNVTGTAALAGTVQAQFLSGPFVKSYTILSAAGGLGGTTFNTLTTTNVPAAFTASLSYTGTDVILGLTAALGQSGGLNRNQSNVAGVLNTFFNNGGTLPANFAGVFGLTGANLANGLSQLSGEIGVSAATMGFQDMDQFLALMLDPFLENRVGGGASPFGGPALAFAPQGNAGVPDGTSAYVRLPTKAPPLAPATFDARWAVWGAAYGANGTYSGNATIGSHDLSARSGGFAAGIDYRVGPNTVIGFAASGSSLSYSLDGGLGSGSGDAFKAGLYASTRFDNAYLSASAAYGAYDLTTSRSVLLPGVGDRLTADVTAQSFGARIETGYRFPMMASSGFTPYAAFQAQAFHLPNYGETDAAGLAAFALTYNGHTFDETRSELGARFDSRLAVADNSILLLRGRLAWAHEFSGDPALTAGFVTLPGSAFTVTGAALPRNALLVSAGPELRLPNGWTLRAKFDGEFSGQSQVYAGTGTLRFTW